MNKEELQKEYLLTLRSIINTIKFDVGECVRNGVEPSQMYADLIDTAKNKMYEIVDKVCNELQDSNECRKDNEIREKSNMVIEAFLGATFKNFTHLRDEIKEMLKCSTCKSSAIICYMKKHGYHLNCDGTLCKEEITDEFVI